MRGNVLIGFPLVVMFLLTLISVGAFEDEATLEFYGTRDVTDNQVTYFDNWVGEKYIEHGNPPWDALALQDIELGFYIQLDDEFGAHTGHRRISELLTDTALTKWDDENAALDENDIRYIISRDPEYIEEWQELQDSRVQLDDVIFFIGLFAGVMIIVGIVGIRVFGIGLAGISVAAIIKLSIFLLLWGILSISSYPYVIGIPEVGQYFWIILTFIYGAGALIHLVDNTGGGD